MIARAVPLSILVLVCLALISEARPPPPPHKHQHPHEHKHKHQHEHEHEHKDKDKHEHKDKHSKKEKESGKSTTTTTELSKSTESIISGKQEVSDNVASKEGQQRGMETVSSSTQSVILTEFDVTNERNMEMNEKKEAEKKQEIMDDEKKRPVSTTGGPMKRHASRTAPISGDDQVTTAASELSDMIDETIKSDAEKTQIDHHARGNDKMETKGMGETTGKGNITKQ